MKRIFSIITLVSFVATNSGCITLKLSDSKPGSRPRAAICEKRTAILVLDDRQTERKLSGRLSEDPAISLSRAIADKFREYCPDKVEFIDRQTTAADARSFSTSADTGNFDFLLTGTLDRLDSKFEDKYQGLRFAGSFIMGLTIPVGLLLLPVVFAGNVDHVTNFDFTISLVEPSNGSILWSGKSNYRSMERVAAVKATPALIEERLNSHIESATTTMFANISSAYNRKSKGT